MDCYGDPKITGKVGTDIEDNKCSWLVVQALAKANAEQRALLEVSTIVRSTATSKNTQIATTFNHFNQFFSIHRIIMLVMMPVVSRR